MKLRGAIWMGTLALSLLVARNARSDTHQKSLFLGNMTPIGAAMDSQGRLHLSWESTNVRPIYMRIGGGQKTVKQIVDPTPQNSISGQNTVIALDSTGSPQIGFWSQRGNSWGLFCAHTDGTSWQLEQVGQGTPLAMAIDPNGQPRILAQNTFELDYFHREDAGWQSEALPLSSNRVTSLVLDSAGHAHLGLSDNRGNPTYVTNSSGSWVQTQLDPNFAAATSLVLDSLEHPHVAEALEVVGTIRYRWFDGSKWQSEDVYDPNDLPAGTTNEPLGAALALDANDRPRILFVTQVNTIRVNRAGFNTTDTTNVLIFAYHDGVEWRTIPLAHGGILDWTRLFVDPTGASQGVYALGQSYLDETQVVRSVSVALPDVTGEWTSLSVTPEGPNVRVTGVLALRNEGRGRSRSAPIGFYFSDDAVLDGTDSVVAIRKSAPALAPGQTKSVRISFLHATPLPAAQLLAVVDPTGSLDDLDRPNNTIAGELQ